jgi:transcription elongation factor
MNYSELSKLSVSELRNINQIVVDLIKQKRNIESLQKKIALQIGMNVTVNHPKLLGKQLKVEKINRTKAVLSVVSGASYGRVSNYTVPVSMIEMA